MILPNETQKAITFYLSYVYNRKSVWLIDSQKKINILYSF